MIRNGIVVYFRLTQPRTKSTTRKTMKQLWEMIAVCFSRYVKTRING